MTKQIKLTQGRFALVDDCDYETLNKYNWSVSNGYATRAKSKKKGEEGGTYVIFMHRAILGLGDKREYKTEVDHINRNKLDNRRSNLRVCTHKQNSVNQRKGNRFGYKGIVKFAFNKYHAMIWDGKKNIHLGSFSTKEEAARAYDAAAKRLHGEYAFLNFPDK